MKTIYQKYFLLFCLMFLIASLASAADIAFIYKADSTAAHDFSAFLASRGLPTHLIPMNEAAATNFDPYDLIVVDSTTGNDYEWGDISAVTRIQTSFKPVLGLGFGGACLFQQMGLSINWGNGWLSAAKQIYCVDPSMSVFSVPNLISIPDDGILQLYNEPSDFIAEHAPDLSSQVRLIGRQSDNDGHYPIVSQGAYWLWGFTDSPAEMTETGRDLFVNIVSYMIANSDVSFDVFNKLVADDGEAGDLFAQDVAIDGDYAVVGAPSDDNDNGEDAGAIYIFKLRGGFWEQQARLTANDGAAGDLFGYSVDIRGDYIAVGACWDDDAGEKSGSVYIFQRDDRRWTQQTKIIAADAGADNRFGIDLALDDGYLLVGAFFDDDAGERSGSAYVFKLDGSGWTQQSKLAADDAAAGDWFGVSVDIDDGYAVIGARYDDNDRGEDAGAAYVFKEEGTDWQQTQKLTAFDGAAGDLFHVVSISGGWIAVGAYGNDAGGDNAGAIYLFGRDGDSWVSDIKYFMPDAAGDLFGASVSIQGRTLVVGANGDDDNGAGAGAVTIFHFDGTNWRMSQKITAADGEAGDYFGLATAVSDGDVIIGARNDDDMGENAGAAYIYQLRLTPETLRVPSEYAAIGEAMAASAHGDTVLVAPGTYDESLTMNEGVALLSEAGPQQTIISGSGVQRLVMGARDAIIDGFTIAGNDNGESAAGSGIWSVDDNVTISHCIIRNNRVGLFIAKDSHARVFNNTICYNSLDGISMGAKPSPEIYNNIISKNAEGIYRNTTDASGRPFIQYNCYYGNGGVNFANEGGGWTPEPGVGDIFEEPLFVGGDPFDFQLEAGSPCIDAGDPDSPADPDGSRADMGALYYEHPTGVSAGMAADQPSEFFLHQAFPNPFNPTTTIAFDVSSATNVELTVFDILGREVTTLVNQKYQPGHYKSTFDAGRFASGVYFYRIRMGDFDQTRKMLLVR